MGLYSQCRISKIVTDLMFSESFELDAPSLRYSICNDKTSHYICGVVLFSNVHIGRKLA